MITQREKAELIALNKRIEKDSTARLRANKNIDFVVRFAAQAQGEVDRVRDAVVGNGVRFDCVRGCAHCCYFRVEALPQETFRIARELRTRDNLDALIATLRASVEKVRGLATERFTEGCPFLAAGACSIYAIRPLICRKCNSLDVEKCKDPSAVVPENPELVHKSGAIVHGTIAAYEKNKLPSQPHELRQSVLLALTDPTAEARWLNGENVFDAIAQAVGPRSA